MADIQFNLRIPAELKDRIAEAAKENNRSINAEAQSRLEQSFDTANTVISNQSLAEKVHVLEEVNKNIMIALGWALEKKSVQKDIDVDHYANKAFDILDQYYESLKKKKAR
ncbi:Arc family DNA-binding protein [Acinetobacter gyllenbergii]|nr:Arc family DNA-binding protein [Acinetobacter gyllenbergii]